MDWKWKGHKEIKEAVNANTGGHADEFIYPSERNYKVQNLDVMAQWLLFYIAKGYPFTVFGDYDADGICASAIMYLLLKQMGAKEVKVRLPRRMSEGYGMKPAAVNEIEKGVVITVDNGISAMEAIEAAKKKGLVILVLDHHEPQIRDGKIVLPKADLIVDPHVPDEAIAKGIIRESSYRNYCGAGLAYKLATLMTNDRKFLGKLSTMAAIATIADVMPLTGDNRLIYHEGIKNMEARNMTPGLQCLIDVLQSGNMVTETDIGFKIAPMLNAPGRIEDDGAEKALSAILASSFYEGRTGINKLNEKNEERKIMKTEAVNRAFDYMKENCLYGVNPVVVYDPETPEGIVGLVAGAITEKYDVTSIVFTEKNGILKGSARAGTGNNIKEALDKLAAIHPEIFLGYGGHAGAAGVSIKKEMLDLFEEEMEKIMPEANRPKEYIEYDIEIPAGDLTKTVDEVLKYAPFGEGNPFIVVRINNFKLVPRDNSFFKEMGSGTLKLFGAGCEAVGFSLMKKYEDENYPTEIDMLGKLSYHYFKGKATPQIEMIDFKTVKKEKPTTVLKESIMSSLLNNGFGISNLIL